MSRMSLDTAIRLSAEVKGGGAIDRVKRSLQDFGKTGLTSKRDLEQLRAATFQFSRANDQTIAGLRNSINAFRGLQEQARIGSREFKRYGDEIKQLEGKLKGVDGAATSAGTSLGQKLAAGLAAAGVGRALQGITAQAGRFDAEVRKAAAIEGGEGSFGVLRKEIEAVAAAAAGTPTQVAALATALSRAGFSAKETTEALAGIVRGAEATSITFEEMGSIAADNLRAFGLQTVETNRVVDVLTQTANKSNQTVLDLGESLKYAAPIARNLGVPLEDLAATMALLANNGIRGSDAGTALRTGLTRLQIAASGSNEELEGLTMGNQLLARAMRSLGSEIIDARGNLLPMDQVILSLRKNIQALSAGRRAEIAKALFGDEAGSKFLALLNSSEEQIKSMFGAVRDSGGVAEATQKKMQGFDYAVKVLGGNVEYLTNQIGGMIGAALMPLISGLNGVIGAAQKLPDPVKQVGAAAAAAGLAVTGLVVGIAALKASLAVVGGVTALKGALVGAAGAAKALAAGLLLNPWVAAAAGVVALTVAAYNMNKPFREFVDSYPQRFSTFWRELGADASTVMQRVTNLAKGIGDFVGNVVRFIRDRAADAVKFIIERAGFLGPAIQSVADGMTSMFSSAFTMIQERWKETVSNMINYSNPLLAVLKGIGIDVGGAFTAALSTDAQRLSAAGSTQTYTVAGITYSTATGAPVSGTQPFTPSMTVPPPAPMLPAAGGGSAGGGGGGGGRAAAAVEKGVKELLRLTDAEITAAVNTAIGEYGGPDPRGRTDVFANILARSRSSQYPSNLLDVVMQPGQYAPNFGRSRAQVTNPNLYGRARFEQVRSELMNAQMLSQSIRDIDSRLYFKGVSQYPNMLRGVDFLRAPGQNFFHGPGGTDPGRNPQITTQLLQELGGGSDLTGYLDAQTQATKDLQQQQAEANKRLEEFIEARTKSITELEKEIELSGATTEIDRRRLEYAFERNEIIDKAKQQETDLLAIQTELKQLGIDQNIDKEKARIENEKNRALLILQKREEQEINDLIAERVRMMQALVLDVMAPSAYNPLEQQKADLDALLQKYPMVGAAAEQAAELATRGFADMVTGARSAKEVFADFLKGMADALIQTAKTMIAQYIAIGIAKMFAGFSGGMGFNPSAAGPFGAGGLSTGLSFTPGFTGDVPPWRFANGGVMSPRGQMPLRTYSRGGVANSPQVAVFGEGMMNEAYVPLPDGRRIPVAMQMRDDVGRDRMRELMGASPAGNGSPVLNMSFETTTINGVEYVSREQLEAAMQETRKRAASDGAKRGMSMTLDRLQQSPSTRSRVGIR